MKSCWSSNEYIKRHRILNAIVYVDFQSVLTALSSLHAFKNSLVRNVRQCILATLQAGGTIRLCCVPNQVGIPGNEKADQLATASRNLDETITDLPSQDFYLKVRSLIQAE